MRRIIFMAVLTIGLAVWWLPVAQAADKKPNILVIWGDDIGQSNLSAYTRGLVGYTTPNIDRIANEGMLFTDSYGEQSCTAGRSSFITGQSVFRTGLSKVGLPGADLGLRAEDPTTGQKLSVYTTLIRGPVAWPGGNPRQRHLILVDNGRLNLRGSPLEEALYCIRCGACLNACPVFREIGGHAYVNLDGEGSLYPGPIGSVLSPALFGAEGYGHLARASTLCGACKDACPVNCSPFDFIMAARVGNPSDIKRSAAEIMHSNPLGGVCGLVCPDRFCMAACSRKNFDSSINIPKVQATIVEMAKRLGGNPKFSIPSSRRSAPQDDM